MAAVYILHFQAVFISKQKTGKMFKRLMGAEVSEIIHR